MVNQINLLKKKVVSEIHNIKKVYNIILCFHYKILHLKKD